MGWNVFPRLGLVPSWASLLLGVALASTSARAQANLALNKPTWATSNDFSHVYAYRTTDGDLDTFWSSAFEVNPWVALDLQAERTVNRVKVQFPDTAANPFNWKLQVLSGGCWVDAYAEGTAAVSTGWTGVRDATFPAVHGRYFRIYITIPSDYGIQIKDFELFGPTGSTFDLSSNAKPSGAGTVTRNPDRLTYTSGSSVTLTATPAANYRFTGWSGDASGTTNPLTVSMTKAKTITATFASTTTTNVALKRPATALATDSASDTAWAVDGGGSSYWTGNSFDDNWYAVDLESNCTVSQAKVYFDPANYPSTWKVQYLANGAWVDLSSEDLSSGGLKTATFPAVTARQFRLHLAFNSALYTGLIRIANFQLIGQTTTNYTLTTGMNLSDSGTLTSPNASGYAPGSVATLSASPAAGYVFSGWSGDATGTTNPLNLTMNADKAITANFTSTTSYKLTTPTVGSGSVARTPSATYYPYRSTVALTPTGSGNFWFSGWSGDASGTANPLNVTMNAATTATATFATASCSKPAAQVEDWSDGQELGFVQPYNNCYNYATNTRTDTFAQPGRWSGNTLSAQNLNVATLLAFCKSDGLVATTKTAVLPYGRTRICLVLDPYYDFHWYRQNANGLWSHKPGNDVARETDDSGNLITDPETADRGTYKIVVGYYSVCSDAQPFLGHSTIQ